MGFCLLLKILLKTWAISKVKNFLIMLKYLKQMQQKLLQREAIQKTAEETGDLISNKIADKIINASKELHSKTDEN